MYIDLKRPQTFEVKYLTLMFEVDEDDNFPENLPGKSEDKVEWTIDLDTSRIRGYSFDRDFDVHVKVRDGGTYILSDCLFRQVITMEQEYVPDGLGKYGDYLIFTITSDGTVKINLDKVVDSMVKFVESSNE